MNDLTTAERKRLSAAALRGRDYFEAERARAMRDYPPKDPSASDVTNVLRYALLDAIDGVTDGRQLDARAAKDIVELQLEMLSRPELSWMVAALSRYAPVAELPPLLTRAETDERRKAGAAAMRGEMAAIRSERAERADGNTRTAAESTGAKAE